MDLGVQLNPTPELYATYAETCPFPCSPSPAMCWAMLCITSSCFSLSIFLAVHLRLWMCITASHSGCVCHYLNPSYSVQEEVKAQMALNNKQGYKSTWCLWYMQTRKAVFGRTPHQCAVIGTTLPCHSAPPAEQGLGVSTGDGSC